MGAAGAWSGTMERRWRRRFDESWGRPEPSAPSLPDWKQADGALVSARAAHLATAGGCATAGAVALTAWLLLGAPIGISRIALLVIVLVNVAFGVASWRATRDGRRSDAGLVLAAAEVHVVPWWRARRSWLSPPPLLLGGYALLVLAAPSAEALSMIALLAFTFAAPCLLLGVAQRPHVFLPASVPAARGYGTGVSVPT